MCVVHERRCTEPLFDCQEDFFLVECMKGGVLEQSLQEEINEWVLAMNYKFSYKCKWVFWENCEHNF